MEVKMMSGGKIKIDAELGLSNQGTGPFSASDGGATQQSLVGTRASQGQADSQGARWHSALQKLPDVELRWNEPLARHTTFRVGGPVSCLARPRTEDALAGLVRELKKQEIPFIILGGGSNVLPPDDLWEVVAVQLGLCCSKLVLGTVRGERADVYVGAGIRIARWIRFCLQNGLAGVECLAGIPGTAGGALLMNAGTAEGCIADTLSWIDLMDGEGNRLRLQRSGLAPAYRSMGLPEDRVVLGASFELRIDSRRALRSRLSKAVARRRRTQPLGLPSAGCIFKNPPEAPAGLLIEKCGLKGFSIGGAEVSRKHANWIVNRGHATAADILALIRHVEGKVFAEFGVRLEREVRVLA